MKRWLFVGVCVAIVVSWAAAPAQDKTAAKLPAGVTHHRNLEYGTHERQRLDIFVPAKTDTAPPLVVWIHGGGWQGGSKDGGSPAQVLLSKGYAVASINYRFSHHAPFPAQIHDCKAAIRYLRAHAKQYGYDTSKIGTWGASAGGHLVALLATTGGMKDLEGDGEHKNQSSRIDAGIDWFGPADFLNWNEEGKPVRADLANNAIHKLFGGTIEAKKSLVKQASPINHITSDTAPLLLVHGDKDTLVPLHQSEIFLAKLKQAKVDADLFVVKGGGHGPGFQAPDVVNACLSFLDRTIKKKS